MSHEHTMAQAKANRDQAQTLLELTQKARRPLELAQEKLGSARNWGIVDILGGGFITNLIKHSRLEDATGYLRQARPLLHQLAKGLRQIHLSEDLDLELGSFAAFADFFFDGVFADVYVQSKIHKLRDQVDQTLSQLERVATTLKKVYTYEDQRIRNAQS